VSGTHSKPTLTRIAEDVTSCAAHLRGKLTRQAMTRMTGGVAVGGALVAMIAATVSVSDGGTPRSGPSLAVAAANQESSTDFLAAEPTAEHPIEPRAKAKKAPARPQHRSVKAEDVIKLAEKQVGIGETNGAGGGTKFQDWYADTNRAQQTVERDGGTPAAYKDAAWCVMFLSWVGNQLDFNDQIGEDAWTIAHANWFKERGRWGTTPKPGAVVYFDWDGGKSIDGIDHVGLVTKVNDDGTVNTVEGNISDAVVSKVRSTDKVVGYGYPDYAK
jgi:surface antigen